MSDESILRKAVDRYEDSVAWAEEQIEALRYGRFWDLDIQGVVEELRHLAVIELEGFEWELIQLMMMQMRILAWPESSNEEMRRFDLNGIRSHVRDSFSPAMRDKVDLEYLYLRAKLLLPETVNKKPPMELPDRCPWTLDMLL